MHDKNNKRIDVKRARLYKQIQISYHTRFCFESLFNIAGSIWYTVLFFIHFISFYLIHDIAIVSYLFLYT